MTRMLAALRRSSILAAFLSFVLPGLGQGWLGRVRRGLILALPVMLLIGFAVGTYLQQGRARLLGILLQPSVLVALLVINVILLFWRVGAIVDAYRIGLGGTLRWDRQSLGWRGATVGLMLIVTLGMHLGFGYLGVKTYGTVAAIFATPEPTASPTVAPSVAIPSGSTLPATPTPLPTPRPTEVPTWYTDGRLDVLLVGGDAGPGRSSLRTDTMILLSVDVITARAALFGIPRNMFNVPLPDGPAALFPGCNCYPDLLNSLFRFAMDRPQIFRGGDQRGYLALQDAVGQMTGLQLDGMVVVTLQGFVRLIDALGGLDITTPYNLYDATYPDEDGTHHDVIWIPAGQHHLDGHLALAYARSRHQDNDYNRMERQQLVLTALRRQICPSDLVFRIPELLDVARDSLWTNLPVSELPDLLELGDRVRLDRLAKYQFWPPDIPEYLTPAAVADIHQIVANPWTPVPTPAPSGVTPAPTAATNGGC
jgi:LCP family protein required for cell wall assembly